MSPAGRRALLVATAIAGAALAIGLATRPGSGRRAIGSGRGDAAPEDPDVERRSDEALIEQLLDEAAPERSLEPREPADPASVGNARPGTERWHRARFLEAARADRPAFERSARETFGAATTLAEDVALLRVARAESPDLSDELAARALASVDGRDPRATRLRDVVFELWLRYAERDAAAGERLLVSVLGDASQPVALRRRAAFTLFGHATASALEHALEAVLEEADATVRADVVRGLKQNGDPTAPALLGRVAREWAWDETVRRLAVEPPSEPVGEDESP